MGCQLPNINEFINNIRENKMEALTKAIERVELGYLAIQLLAGEGVYVEPNQYAMEWGDSYDVDVKQLPAIRLALGRLSKTNSYPVQNTRKAEIFVVLRPVHEQFKHIQFRYRAKLPKGAKCRIVTSKEKRSTRQLVCEA